MDYCLNLNRGLRDILYDIKVDVQCTGTIMDEFPRRFEAVHWYNTSLSLLFTPLRTTSGPVALTWPEGILVHVITGTGLPLA